MMPDDLKPRLLEPGEDVVGAASPVQRAQCWLVEFFALEPEPNVRSARAQTAGCGLGTHLLHLLRGFGILNLNGYHSSAAALLRPLEDALDCFAAVVLVDGTAESWSDGHLRASDAARAWAPVITDMVARGMSLSDYRRRLREQFNDLSHCPPELCAWNLYFSPTRRDPITGAVSGTLELNMAPRVIASNAHALDAHCTGHLLEFLYLVRRGYSSHLETRPLELQVLSDLIGEIKPIVEEHDQNGCLQVRPPPEVRKLKW
jgi:hypothetical protein